MGVRGDLFGSDVVSREAATHLHETLRRSSLAEREPGSTATLELALRADGRLGGHIVQDRVDGLAVVRSLSLDGFSGVVEFDAGPEPLRYTVEKRSIVIDGISLTVSAIGDDQFAGSLIAETLERTALGAANVGRSVNLEVDVLAKYVEKPVAR